MARRLLDEPVSNHGEEKETTMSTPRDLKPSRETATPRLRTKVRAGVDTVANTSGARDAYAQACIADGKMFVWYGNTNGGESLVDCLSR
jgi:hypothetical protein